MTPREIVAEYRAGRLPYPDAYQLLAYAGDPNPRATLTGQAVGWLAVYERPAVGGWSR